MASWFQVAFACAALVGTLSSLPAQSARAVPRGKLVEEPTTGPGNILVLIADDLGVDQLAAYGLGTELAPTPNLDGLAAQGVLFRNAWSQPTCTATRATIQTGRYGFRTRIGASIYPYSNAPALELGEVTLPEMLDLGTGARYAHAMIGKWHLGSYVVGGDFAPNWAGYDHFSGSLEGQIATYFSWRKVVDGVVSTSTRYATSACVDDALLWIGQQTRPWMCVVGFQAPHAPFHAPPANLHTQSLPGATPTPSCPPPGGTDARPFYRAMVQALDTEIGRLLADLPAGVRARTTVLFLGDNGSESCVRVPPFPSLGKATVYEGGVSVPLIASGYRVSQGESSALVSTTDLFATVAELAGVDLGISFPGLELDSVSFAASLQDPGHEQRTWIYAESFTANGPGQPPLLPECPAVPLCQENLGFDGPGNVALASCGDPLYGIYGANLVPWQVSGGPPLAFGWLRVGANTPAFDPGLGATVVSSTPAYTQAFQLDALGSFQSTLWTGTTSDERHYQVVVEDPGQAQGFAVSNALRMNLLSSHVRAVRNQRYKLIRLDPCKEQLFDLALDPLELTDLLQAPLAVPAFAALIELSDRLDTLH